MSMASLMHLRQRSSTAKSVAVALSLFMPFALAPYSPAEPGAVAIGTVVTAGTVTIGKGEAPTGTTLFSGDKLAASGTPALVTFSSGSRMEMIAASATISRAADELLVQPGRGLFRFSLVKGERFQFDAGRYRFKAITGDSSTSGELGLNGNGQVALTVTEGAFAALDREHGEKSAVSPGSPLIALTLEGQGTIARNGRTLTDASKSFGSDELKGKCILAGKEAYRIVGNSATVVEIKGAWKLESSTYAYQIVTCDSVGLAAAEPGSQSEPAGSAPAGLSGTSIAAIVAGVAGAGLGIGILVHEVTKSSSSR